MTLTASLPIPSLSTHADGPATTASHATTTRFLDRPSGRIAYDDQGVGPLVVMVPGLGDVRAEYRFLAAELVKAGYRAVAMDIRGHGESSVGWPAYDCAALGSDIVALVEHLDAGPATVIGTSMGAGAAVWAETEAPEHINALIVIGPFVRDVPPKNWLTGIAQKLMVKVAFAGPWAAGVWGGFYAGLYPTAKPADFDAYRQALVANLQMPGRMAAVKAMASASKADVEARLDAVRAATLVVMGSKDPDFADPAGEAENVAHRLNGTVSMIEGAGHYPHAEMPEATLPTVLDFLATHARR